MKISSSCSKSMPKRISNSNSKKISTKEEHQKECNNRMNRQCPFQGECRSTDNVYLAEVFEPDSGEVNCYVGASSTEIRARIATHTSDSKYSIRNKKTTLSARIYQLCQTGVNHNVSFSRILQASSYRAGSRECKLCSKEVEQILFNDTLRMPMMNSRQEIFASCMQRHRWKLKLHL